MWHDVHYLPNKLGIVILLALTVFVGAVRPLTRHAGRLSVHFGLTRMSLLTEPPRDGQTRLPGSESVASVQFVRPLPAIALLLVLKVRRVAFQPVRIRRVKRPPRRPASPSPH